MAQRIKGQEVEVILIVDGQPQSTITDVRSCEVALQTEIQREGYLGETTDRRDSVFRGARGRMELHIENDDVFDLFSTIVNKARRRTPGTRINVKATLQFPNGDRKLVIFPDAEFGELPLNFASRTDYGSVTLDFESSSVNFI